MHRKLGWYLVELENELRSSKTEAERAELLKEVESHVREHADDLHAKGMDEQHAMDSALLAFGPPSEIARVSWKAPRWLLALISFALLYLSYNLISNVVVRSNNILVERWDLPPFNFAVVGVAFALVAVLALITRKLVAPFVCAGALAITVFYCFFIASQYSFVDFNGSRYLVGKNQLESMASDRKAWVDQYSTLIKKIGDPKTQQQDVLLAEIKGDNEFYSYPIAATEDVRSYLYKPMGQQSLSPIVMPSTAVRIAPNGKLSKNVDELLLPGAAMPYLANTISKHEAVAGWRENGDFYIAGLKARILLLEDQIKALDRPQASTFSERFMTVSPVPLLVVGIMSLIAIAMNIVLMWPIAYRNASKQKAWRRRFV